ncbi:uncharacterized protein TNCT_21341 [Trichonephila clavata]|uniref:Uncharacterized protein n=1 Tax=Trichonephila clavata TaxID=2740835 RepID=A0A8X6KKY2_TRICU|nr:uncharacterized protein TNCT_21341 [Trichonephila clavata]
MENLNNEYFFAFDLVSFVLKSYDRTWQTVSLLPRSGVKRFFFSQSISNAVTHILDKEISMNASYCFDHWFKQQQINYEHVKNLMKFFTINFCMEGYSSTRFLETCCFISELSALSYIYGVCGAPQYAIFCITHILSYFKRDGQFFDFSWLELEDTALGMQSA